MIRHCLPPENLASRIKKVPYSLESFNSYLSIKRPIILTGMVKDWPAMKLWDVDYLIGKCGNQEIFVKNIRKNLKSVSKFRDAMQILLKQKQQQNLINENIVIQMAQIKTGRLFSRGSAALEVLLDDIILPKEIPPKRIVEVNFWAGSGNNITELHYDPLNNLLSVIQGSKEVILFSPSESKKLYNALPEASKKSVTHSLVDICNVDTKQYPEVLHAKYHECFLSEGETLFIPNGYWHVVESLDFNVAVNIWWLPKFQEFFRQPVNQFWKAEILSRTRGKGSCVPHSIKKDKK